MRRRAAMSDLDRHCDMMLGGRARVRRGHTNDLPTPHGRRQPGEELIHIEPHHGRDFPHAGHSLMETPSRKGMAPGVFDDLRTWLLARVRLPRVVVKG